jgi:hypothetical protein
MGEREADGADDANDAGEDAPLGDLADRVRRRRADREDDPFAALEDAGERDGDDPDPATAPGAEPAETADEDPFESVAVDEIDTDELWASLESEGEGAAAGAGADDGSAAAEQPEVGSGGAAERVERDDPEARRVDHLVPKAAYCQRCRHLAAPPEVRCTHEGTEIVEVADADHFRVRGCPMVDEDGPVEGTPDLDG